MSKAINHTKITARKRVDAYRAYVAQSKAMRSAVDGGETFYAMPPMGRRKGQRMKLKDRQAYSVSNRSVPVTLPKLKFLEGEQ